MPVPARLSSHGSAPGICDSGDRRKSRVRRRMLQPARAPIVATLLVFGLLGLAVPASAHYPWITVSEDAEGDPTFRLGFGHVFPGDGPLGAHRVDGIRVIGSDDAVEPLVLEDREIHPLPNDTEGTRLIVAEQTPLYWSRTHQGGRQASREQYPDAFSCSQSGNVMKAAFGDGGGSAWQYQQGHVLELIPQRDPVGLRPGDPLSIRVLFHGEPWEGEVKATYEGYDGGSSDRYVLTLRTDADGMVRFVPAASGYWLVRANASEDYPDPAVCDRRSYFSTLTFEIR